MTRRVFRLTVMLLVLLAPVASTAQVVQAELRGSVVDESGGALPGVTVTATNTETGVVRTTVTSETGVYLMPALPLGPYQVKVELAGFATVVREGLRLGVGEAVTVNFTMGVAKLEETITVTGESPLVDTQKSGVSGRVEPSQVENLPLSGRNWLDLVALVPGARGNPGQVEAGASGNDAARYQMDGLNVTGQGTGAEIEGFSSETVAEFQVLTNRYDAEYGRVTGAVINAVTKTGTNQIRGSGYMFIRNDFLDAKNFFTDKVSPFDEKQMGLTLGGPIVRDKFHFFGAYEYQKRNITAHPNTGVPQFDVDVAAPINRHMITARTDVQLSNNNRLFVRATMYKWLSENNGVGGANTPSSGYDRPSTDADGVIGDTWVINNQTVHELRAGMYYFNRSLKEVAAMPRHAFPSAILGPPTNVPQWWKERIFQLSDSLSYFIPSWHGEHRLKAGFQWTRAIYEGWLPSISYGNYTFPRNPTNYNDPSTYPPPSNYTTTLGDLSYYFVNPIYAGFFQDDWRPTSRLTLNLGVRYDLEPRVNNPDLEDPEIEPEERNMDMDNFAPRAGFTYDVSGDGRTVIRGGAGRYYGNILLNIPMNEQRDRADRVAVSITNPVYGDPLQGMDYEDFVNLKLPRARTVLAHDFRVPKQDQYTIGFARQLGVRYAAQVDFVHADGSQLQMSRGINYFENAESHLPLDPTRYGRPWPQYSNITLYESTGKSRYDGLQMGMVSRRGTGRYEFQASYTLSWTKGHTDANRFGSVNNPFNLDDDYAYLLRDQRHRFTMNGTAYLWWNFQLSAIFFAGSKRPINIGTNLDPFRLGSTGRWLGPDGSVLPKNGERVTKNDYKLDIRLSKTFRLGRVSVQGIMDVFNMFNIENYDRDNYGRIYPTSTYLKPGSSTNLFYQPRQVQFAFRVTY